jgi:hypothetical protein
MSCFLFQHLWLLPVPFVYLHIGTFVEAPTRPYARPFIVVQQPLVYTTLCSNASFGIIQNCMLSFLP